MKKKLPVWATIKEGCTIGFINFFSLLAASILYLLTIWIPYLNVGTTIAFSALPAVLAQGKVVNPLFIFESKYRRNMGEFFILYALMTGAICAGLLFGIIPGLVISIAWSFAVVLFVDKDLSAMDALHESNRITYGNKWRMFGITLLFVLFIYVLIGIIMAICFGIGGNVAEGIGVALTIIIAVLCIPVAVGLDASMYRQLTAPEEEVKVEQPAAAPVEEKKAEAKSAKKATAKKEPAKKEAAKKPAAKKPAAKKPAAKKAPAKK